MLFVGVSGDRVPQEVTMGETYCVETLDRVLFSAGTDCTRTWKNFALPDMPFHPSASAIIHVSSSRYYSWRLLHLYSSIFGFAGTQGSVISGSTESCEASSLSLRTRQSTSIETLNRFEALMHAGDVAEDVQPQYYNQQHVTEMRNYTGFEPTPPHPSQLCELQSSQFQQECFSALPLP
eukprot:g42897.t1